MKNTTDLSKALDSKAMISIGKMLRNKFTIPCEVYGVDVEDFIQEVFAVAYKRANYDASKSSVITYVFWIARTEMSHIKDGYERKARNGETVYFDHDADQDRHEDFDAALIDHSNWSNPLQALIAREEYIEALDKLSEHFDCTMASVERLLNCEPKDILCLAKQIVVDELMDDAEAAAFLRKVRQARTNGGFRR